MHILSSFNEFLVELSGEIHGSISGQIPKSIPARTLDIITEQYPGGIAVAVLEINIREILEGIP